MSTPGGGGQLGQETAAEAAYEELLRCHRAGQEVDCATVARHFSLSEERVRRYHAAIRALEGTSSPSRIDRFRLQEPLGRGGMGTVYRAWDDQLERQLAIKILNEAVPNTHQLQRFEREAKALAALNHPHIVRCFTAGIHEKRPFIAMELLEGETLEAQLAREGPLSSPEAARLVMKLSGAVSAAHTEGLLHRDLKPANVFMTSEGEPILTDFGLTKRLGEQGSDPHLTQAGSALGTPGYWAPEQASGDLARVGPATDVFGLGTILYAALTGEPPSGGWSWSEAPAQERTSVGDPAARVPTVDAELGQICSRCLALEPGDRYPTAWDLYLALSAYSPGGGASASPPSPQLRGRGPGLRVAAVCFAVVLLAALATLLARSGAPPAPPANETGPLPAPARETDTLPVRASVPTPAPAPPLASGTTRAALLLCEKGQRLAMQGDSAGALNSFQEALEHDPNLAWAYLGRGAARAELGLEKLAVQDFDKALQLDPNQPQAYLARAYAGFRQGANSSAVISDLHRALELDPSLAHGYLLRAYTYIQQGQTGAAQADAKRVLELTTPGDPMHVEASQILQSLPAR